MIKHLLCLSLTLFFVSLPALASDPELSYYIFESRGNATSGKMLLENKDNPVKSLAPWFDWNCVAHKQKDGILMDCRRGSEFVETKVYCNLPQSRFGRLVRLGKDENFITFEARCFTSKPSRTAHVSKPKKKKKKYKPASPVAEPALGSLKETPDNTVAYPQPPPTPPADPNAPVPTK